MTPELSNAPAIRAQLHEGISAPLTPQERELLHSVNQFLTKAFKADHLTMTYDLITHLHDQIAFSEHTFGPGASAPRIIDHIRKELLEIEKNPTDLEEWIDVILLGLDGAWRSGASAEMIAQALHAKLEKNKARTWPDWRTADQNKAIEHVREKAPCAACDRQDFTIGHSDECTATKCQTCGEDTDTGLNECSLCITSKTAHSHTPALLEWDEKWGGFSKPEKRGYMIGDHSITLFIINRETHTPDCGLLGAFVPDADENDQFKDESDAKEQAEYLTRKWLNKQLTALHSHAPAPEHTPHNS